VIHFACPQCGVQIGAAPEHVGRLVPCPSCGASAPVPSPHQPPPPRSPRDYPPITPLIFWVILLVFSVIAAGVAAFSEMRPDAALRALLFLFAAFCFCFAVERIAR
jgi:hypothetical protein